jgi:hypothetical protein
MPQLPELNQRDDSPSSWWDGKWPWLVVGLAFAGGLVFAWWGPRSSKTAADLVPVQGVVYFQDKPLPGGTIVFSPDPRRGQDGPMGMGSIDDQGFFRIWSDGREGVAPGYYAVTIASSGLPSRFLDPSQSGQIADIRSNLNAPLEFHLK